MGVSPASHVASFLGTLEASISKLPCFTLAKPIQIPGKIYPKQMLLQFHTIYSFVLFACFLFVPTKKNLSSKTLHPKQTRWLHFFFTSFAVSIRRFLPSTNLSRAPWFESVESFPSSCHLNRTAFPSWTWSRLQIVSLSCLKTAGGLASWKSRETNG